jgi:hypothetical protein
MKNLNYLKLLTLFLIFSSCNKNDEISSDFSEELIIGNWEILEFNFSDSNQ